MNLPLFDLCPLCGSEMGFTKDCPGDEYAENDCYKCLFFLDVFEGKVRRAELKRKVFEIDDDKGYTKDEFLRVLKLRAFE